MAWNANTFANALMTVALVMNRGIFSAMMHRFTCVRKVKQSRTAEIGLISNGTDSRRKPSQFRTPLQTFAGSIGLSGLSCFAFSSKTSDASG